MPCVAKIQLRGQLTIDRRRTQPLSLQVADQLQAAIEGGTLASGGQFPSRRVTVGDMDGNSLYLAQ